MTKNSHKLYKIKRRKLRSGRKGVLRSWTSYGAACKQNVNKDTSVDHATGKLEILPQNQQIVLTFLLIFKKKLDRKWCCGTIQGSLVFGKSTTPIWSAEHVQSPSLHETSYVVYASQPSESAWRAAYRCDESASTWWPRNLMNQLMHSAGKPLFAPFLRKLNENIYLKSRNYNKIQLWVELSTFQSTKPKYFSSESKTAGRALSIFSLRDQVEYSACVLVRGR